MIKFFTGFFYSWLLFFLCFYIPGRIIIRKFKNTTPQTNLIISFVLGIAIWGLQGYILGYANLRNFTWLYLIGFSFLFLKNLVAELNVFKRGLQAFFQDKLFLLILSGGLIITLAGVLPSGLKTDKGIWIYDINRIDGTYHLSLIESIKDKLPPREPGLRSSLVKNYHYWSDLVLAEIDRLFNLPTINLFYHYFPTFLAVLLGLTAYHLANTLFQTKTAGRIMTFLTMYSGGLGTVILFIFSGEIILRPNLIYNSAVLFLNPPRALAETLFLGGILTCYQWLKIKELKWGMITALILGTTVGFKVYVGIIASLGLAAVFFYHLWKKRYLHLLPVILSALISMAIFFPANASSGSFFFVPFSWPRHFFAEGKAQLLQWHLQEQVFKQDNNLLRLYFLYIQMTVTFFVFNHGTRLLGVIGIKRVAKKIKLPLFLFLITPVVIVSLFPVFFLQDSGPFEIFNFIASSGIILSLFTAGFISAIEQTKLKKIFIALFILLTIPRPLVSAYDYLNNVRTKQKAELFTQADLDMFNYIKNKVNEQETILVNPKDKLGRYTPYLVAFTGKRVYFQGGGVLRAHGLKVDKKENQAKQLINQIGQPNFSAIAKDNSIDYIYLRTSKLPEIKDPEIKLMKQTSSAILWQID
jgi:hypothetical protein